MRKFVTTTCQKLGQSGHPDYNCFLLLNLLLLQVAVEAWTWTTPTRGSSSGATLGSGRGVTSWPTGKWNEKGNACLLNGYRKSDRSRIDFSFFNAPTPASFCLFSVFSNKQYNFYNKSMWKNVQMKKNVQMSIQYMAPGYEPTTFRTWVSSHNH